MEQLLLPLILLLVFYLVAIRPQQQRVKRHRDLVATLDVGDEVVSAGGIVGRIAGLDDERVELEVSPGVLLTVLRGAIGQKLDRAAGVADADEAQH